MNEKTFVITKYNNGIIGIGFENGNIIDISYDSPDTDLIGNIYVAKVTQIVSNIDSAFILYGEGKRGYLSLREITNPVIINRKYDGRLLSGDEIIVQLKTEAIRTKDPVFTTNISLAGKYSVISNENKIKAVSSKLDNKKRDLLKSIIPEDIEFGVVIRTNAGQLIEEEKLDLIVDEVYFLNNRLNELLSNGIHRTVYSIIYKAPGSYVTTLRDNNISYDRIVTDIEEIYEELSQNNFCVSLYNNENLSISNLYSIETKIDELVSKKVWLKSGAYLIIEQTEAMYVIDVNSGKNNTKKTNSEYVYNINREAAQEIMRQLRLRNMSGMILVDFINMDSKEHENKLFSELSRLALQDPVKTIIVDYTKLGLLEITRKKSKKSLNCLLKA